MAVERLLTGGESSTDPALVEAVTQVRTFAGGPAPMPTPALADLLERGFEPTVVPFRRPGATHGRRAIRAGTAAIAVAASVLVAGSAAALPPAMQDTVADLVAALTPFELPRATPEVAPRPVAPVPAEDVVPSEAPEPVAVPVPVPVPAESGVPGPAAPSSTVPAPPVGERAPSTGHADSRGPGSDGSAAVDGQDRGSRPVEEPQRVGPPASTSRDDTRTREAVPVVPEREPPGTPRP